MTLRIAFGKLVKDPEAGADNGLQGFDVEECPALDYDLCSEEHTIYPRDPIRDGPYATFPDFVQQYLPRFYKDLGVSGVAKLSDYYEEIMNLPDSPRLPNAARRRNVGPGAGWSGLDADRLKWFKFWAKRAMDLYGSENAGVKCS